MREHLLDDLDPALRLELDAFLFDWFDARCQPPSPREIAPEHEAALREAVAHRDTGDAEAALDWFWQRQRVFDAAARHTLLEPLCRRAVALAEDRLGPDHPKTSTALNNLARLLQTTNRLAEAEAEPLMRRALAIDEASYGAEHPSVAICLSNLAQLLKATNRLAEAEPLMRRALAIDEASYGAEHPDVAIPLNNQAALLWATNRLAEAEPLIRRAVLIWLAFTRDTGHRHPNLPAGFGNYRALRLAQTQDPAEVIPSLASLGAEAGLDAATWQRLLAELLADP